MVKLTSKIPEMPKKHSKKVLDDHSRVFEEIGKITPKKESKKEKDEIPFSVKKWLCRDMRGCNRTGYSAQEIYKMLGFD